MFLGVSFLYDFKILGGIAVSSEPSSMCGERDPVVLEFHHLGEKSNEVSRLMGRGASLDALKAEISRCSVVCANCHRRITAEDRGWDKKR